MQQSKHFNTDFTEKKLKPRSFTEKRPHAWTGFCAHSRKYLIFSVKLCGLSFFSVKSVLKCLLALFSCYPVPAGRAAYRQTDGRVGDGLITMADLSEAQKVRLYNHDAYQLAAGTLDPVADIGDVIIVSNYAKVHARSLVVTPFEHQLLARRYNEAEIHPHIAVLTGQATDPTAIAQPIIAPKERITPRKIVGTLFTKSKLPVPPKGDNAEFVALPGHSVVHAMLQDAKLSQVSGRSAEPIALDGQFIMTQPIDMTAATVAQMDGRLVIAVDEDGVRYFKRFRPHGAIIVLESLNPDGTSPASSSPFRASRVFRGLPSYWKRLAFFSSCHKAISAGLAADSSGRFGWQPTYNLPTLTHVPLPPLEPQVVSSPLEARTCLNPRRNG